MAKRLNDAFFYTSTESIAERLLGVLLVRNTSQGRISGWIVETEAYLGAGDPASHSHIGLRARNRSMFDKPGTLYVYSIHSRFCLNVVTDPPGVGAAVLIRAIEPHEGKHIMQSIRNCDERDLARGPARLCQALGIDRTHDGLDLLENETLWLEESLAQRSVQAMVRRSPRIGISKAKEAYLRFFINGNRYVSGLAKDHSRPNRERIGHEDDSNHVKGIL